jgi:hypothetical protein
MDRFWVASLRQSRCDGAFGGSTSESWELKTCLPQAPMQFQEAWRGFRPYLRFVLALLSGDATQNGPYLPRVLSRLNDGGPVACVEELGVDCQAFGLADESSSPLPGEKGMQQNVLIYSTSVVAVVGTNPPRLLFGEHPPEPRGHGYVAEYSLERIDSLDGSTVRISNLVMDDAEAGACVELGRLDLPGSGKTHQIA